MSFRRPSRARSKLTAIASSSYHLLDLERGQLVLAQAEQVAIDVAVVFAQERRPAVHEGGRARELDRIALVLELADLRVLDDRVHVAVLELRIVLHPVL